MRHFKSRQTKRETRSLTLKKHILTNQIVVRFNGCGMDERVERQIDETVIDGKIDGGME